ncbi:MAG: hypothetical protein KIT58_15935 [Planctomycetota bacterium]|nr:hypothetical protein [Planctomycetota bacterium]
MIGKRVLHYAPFALMSPHFETDLELMQERLGAGCEVHVLVCGASLPWCEENPEHRLTVCAMCVARRREGLGRLDRGRGRLAVRDVLNLGPRDRSALGRLPVRFDSTRALREFEFEGFDAGLAVLSSLVSSRRDPAPSPHVHARDIETMLRAACAVFLSTRNWVRTLRPDLAFTFNGRFSSLRPFVRACEAEGVPFFTHDRGATPDKYGLFPNTLPHDPKLAERRIREAWAAAPAAEARRIAARFFEDRARGTVYNWTSFTTAQRKGLRPEPWPEERIKLALFLSSEDELVAISDKWQNPVYADQWAGLFAILGELRGDDRFHAYVRCHPNSARVRDRNFTRLLELAGETVTVIPPESPVCSYTLLRDADRVVSFGSTTGIEATYWGRPSILAGPSFYRPLGGTYNPADHQALMRLLTAPALSPREVEPALMYGFYCSTFGTPFRHFVPAGLSGGTFNGGELRGHQVVRRVLEGVARAPFAAVLRRRLRRAARAISIARMSPAWFHALRRQTWAEEAPESRGPDVTRPRPGERRERGDVVNGDVDGRRVDDGGGVDGS